MQRAKELALDPYMGQQGAGSLLLVVLLVMLVVNKLDPFRIVGWCVLS